MLQLTGNVYQLVTCLLNVYLNAHYTCALHKK